MIGCHCHLEFMPSIEDVIKEARKKMTGIVTSATEPQYYKQMMDLKKQHLDFVHLCLGMHPTRVSALGEKEAADAMKFIKNNQRAIVAVGEVGIDYYHLSSVSSREDAEKLFIKMIDLANRIKKPLVVHSRNSAKDETSDGVQKAIDLLELARVPVMMHFFSGTKEQMIDCVGRGYYISDRKSVV